MPSRASEILLVAMLVMMSVMVAFEFQNHQMIRDMLVELRVQRQTQPSSAAHTPQLSAQPPAAQALPTPQQTFVLPGAPGAPGVPGTSPATSAPAAPLTTVAATEPPAPAEPPATAEPAAAKPQPKTASKQPVATKQATAPAAAPSPPLAAPPPPVDPKIEAAWQAHGPIVTQIVQDLLGGKYDRVVRRFDPTLAANLPTEKVAQAMDPIRQRHGEFKSVVAHEPMHGAIEPTMQGWKLSVEQADGHRSEFWITLDEHNRIAGILMK